MAVGWDNYGQTSGASSWSEISQPAPIYATSSPALADGESWFNLRTKDKAGNWTDTVHVGPFVIDTIAPSTDVTVSPSAPTGDDDWYTTTPTITLTGSEAGTTYFSWDTTETFGTTTAGQFDVPDIQAGEHPCTTFPSIRPEIPRRRQTAER